MQHPIRVLLVDDHPMVLSALSALLDKDGRFEVVGQVKRARDVPDAVEELNPHVVVLDLQLPDGEAVASIPKPVRTIVFSGNEEASVVHRVLKAGALSYVTKSVDGRSLANAVAKTAMGLRVVLSDRPGLRDEVRRFSELARRSATLTSREVDVLRCLMAGATNEGVAQRLGISVRTVETHRWRLRAKLEAESKADLFTAGRRLRIEPMTPSRGTPLRRESG